MRKRYIIAVIFVILTNIISFLNCSHKYCSFVSQRLELVQCIGNYQLPYSEEITLVKESISPTFSTYLANEEVLTDDDEPNLNVDELNEIIQTAVGVTDEPSINSRHAVIYERTSRTNFIWKKGR